MTCRRIVRLLPGYLDGALPERLGPEGHADIASHLETCLSCRRELERYRHIQRVMSVSNRPMPPADLGVRFDGSCRGSKACRAPPARYRVEQHNWQLTVGSRCLDKTS